MFKFGPLFNYVSEPDDAMVLLARLVDRMNARQRDPSDRVPIIVVADEIADMTGTNETTAEKHKAVYLWSLLARKARSARISLILATQHPRFDDLPKKIANNLLRKVMLPVDNKNQAEVVLGFRPDVELPQRVGEFLLKEGIGIKRGRTMRVRAGEIDGVLVERFNNLDDDRLKLWRVLSSGKVVGDSVDGADKAYRENTDEYGWRQTWVRDAYGHFREAGVLEHSGQRGARHTVAVPFVEGAARLQQYIDGGRWGEEPEPAC